MIFYRRFLPLIAAVLLICAAWLWWNRPQQISMLADVPADSIIYLEANDLPAVINSIIQTDAWRMLAPSAEIKSNLSNIGWLSRLSAWTGIGTADTVVFARAQVAVMVQGFDVDAGRVKPRAAAVLETHTSERRTRAAIEQRIGDFARRSYTNVNIERKQMDGAQWISWSESSVRSDEGHRRLIAAVTESFAVIGNDEEVVRACLAAHRGERPTLSGNAQLEEMRARVNGNDALAFGYVSPAGAAKLLEIAAALYAGQISSNARAQSFAASLLPRFAGKVLGSLGWSAHMVNGKIEDRYFLKLQNGVAAQLNNSIAQTSPATFNASELLPAQTYSLTRYCYADPPAAWRGLNASISSQLDALSAALVQTFLHAALQPYGIEDPNQFLRAIGSEAVTARLDNTGASTVLIVEVRNENALRTMMLKRLGAYPRTERIKDAELLVSKDSTRGAVSFVADHLIIGSSESVRRCLMARSEGRTLAAANDFSLTMRTPLAAKANGVLTLTDDEAPARDFVSLVAAQTGATSFSINDAGLSSTAQRLPYAVTETRLTDTGFQRTTQSSFGQFGAIALQLMHSDEDEK